MSEFLTVLKYTFRENIRKTAFIVSTIIILILTIAMMIVPGMIKNGTFNSSNGKDAKQKSAVVKNFYIIDNAGLLQQDLSPFEAAFKEYRFDLKPNAGKKALMKLVKEDENKCLLVLGEQSDRLNMDYYVKTYGSGPERHALQAMVNTLYDSKLLGSAGVDKVTKEKVLATPGIKVNELGQGYFKSKISSMIIILVLFFAIYYFGYGIAISVASEKSSRVMETLVTSTKPSNIILGKTAAMGLLGLSQLTLILLTAAITYKLFFPKYFTMFGQSIDFSAFTPLAILMILVYFMLGYLLYAMMYAVAGASVSSSDDVNAAIMPITMISLISFYLAYLPATLPTPGKTAIATSIIPFTAPFSMPGRLLSGSVSTAELTGSIVVLAATILLFSWISVKIYSAAILHYGNRLKIGELIKLVSQLS
jgi:ABC-2 type transport system permease protein